MQSIPHLFPDCRPSSAGAEHQLNQAKYVTMRQENQPSLTGLVLLGIVPSTGSALYLRFHSVQLECAEPCWAIIRSSLRDFTQQTAVATPGLERNVPPTEPCACDPALISRPGKAWARLKAVPFVKNLFPIRAPTNPYLRHG